jgi:hypothetical protein
MSFDLKRTWCSNTVGRPLAAGTIIQQEGLILCAVVEDGAEKLKLIDVVQGGEIPLGYSKTADSLPDRTAYVEAVTVPAAPATLEADLRNRNLVLGLVRAVDSNNVVLAIDPVFAGAPAANTVKIDLAQGRVKFNATQAGLNVTFIYLYMLTLTEAKQKFGERFINNRGLHAEFGFCEVGSGHTELYTDQYDASVDWSVGNPILLGSNGQLVQAGAGPVLKASVIHVPGTDSPYLGVRIHFHVF